MNLQSLPAVIKRRIPTVRLPDNYMAACVALVACSRVDEVKEWSDKAEGVASYARQANDTQMFDLAQRIKNRAERRLGELLDDLKRKDADDDYSKPREPLGVYIGRRRRENAVNLASIPEKKFEESNSQTPAPTVISLLKQNGAYTPMQVGKAEFEARRASMGVREREHFDAIVAINQLRLVLSPYGRAAVSAGGAARYAVKQEKPGEGRVALRNAIVLAEWLDEFIKAGDATARNHK